MRFACCYQRIEPIQVRAIWVFPSRLASMVNSVYEELWVLVSLPSGRPRVNLFRIVCEG
jgi:hypothetical protein